VLESPFLLDLSFFCTRSTPVADMSTHSPLPPFIINCLDLYDDTFTDDRLGIILVLWCASILYYYSNVADAPCDLTRKISESGILLFIELHPYYRSFAEYTEMVESPEILPASCLCYLIMMAFNIPANPPLFMTMENLVLTSTYIGFTSTQMLYSDNFHSCLSSGNTFNPHSPQVIGDIGRQLSHIFFHEIHCN